MPQDYQRSTVYIALNYLHSYIHKDENKKQNMDFDFDMIYQHVITSLILGNKFNDDKMFCKQDLEHCFRHWFENHQQSWKLTF